MNILCFIRKIKLSEDNYNAIVFEKKNKVYSFINPYGYHLLRKNIDLYNQLDGLFVDGILMCIYIRIFYKYKITRRSFDMTTVARDLFARLKNSRETIYFVGAKQNEIETTVSLIRATYPTIQIKGFRNGYFGSDQERLECMNEIVDLDPDFVVVGMGAILQEKFIVQLHKQGFKGISFTCGGYLRQASVGLEYFPKWSEKYHLRAFYRLYKEKGMFKRLYNVLIEFPILFIYDFFSLFFIKKNR